MTVPQAAEAVPIAFRSSVECGALPASLLEPMIQGAASRHGIHPSLVTAVVRRESRGIPCAVSPKGAMGLMQLMPSTATSLGVLDPFDPRENLEGGVRFLRELLDRYGGDPALALGAYNAGPRRVDEAGGIPAIAETQAYVRGVLRHARLASTSLEIPELP